MLPLLILAKGHKHGMLMVLSPLWRTPSYLSAFYLGGKKPFDENGLLLKR